MNNAFIAAFCIAILISLGFDSLLLKRRDLWEKAIYIGINVLTLTFFISMAFLDYTIPLPTNLFVYHIGPWVQHIISLWD